MKKPKRRKRRLRWLIWPVVLLATAVGGTYWYATRPDRLRAGVLQLLARLPVEAAHVGSVSFSLWTGLEVRDLEIVLPRDPSAPPEQEVSRVSCARARIDIDWTELVRGKVHPKLVEFDSAEAWLVYDLSAPTVSGRLGFGKSGEDWGQQFGGLEELPPINVDRADIRVLGATGDATNLLRRWVVHATGRPEDGAYALRVESFGSPAQRIAEVTWDAQQIRAAVGALDIETIVPLMPPKLAELQAHLALRGRLQLDELIRLPRTSEKNQGKLAAAHLRLTDISAAVPIDVDANGELLPPAKRFLQFTDGDVEITLERGDTPTWRLRANGLINGAETQVEVACAPPDDETLALDADHLRSLTVRARGLAFPPPERRDALVKSPHVPEGVQDLLWQFEPIGKTDLDLSIDWADSENGRPSRITGRATFADGYCKYFRFPYLFSNVCGTLDFSEKGITVTHMTAQHGGAAVEMTGFIHPPHHNAGFDLLIRGWHVPLSDELYAALPPRYQKLWEEAGPLGTCDVDVSLGRENRLDTDDAAKVEVAVDARLFGGSLSLRGEQRLTHAEGTLHVKENTVSINELRGWLGDTAVRLWGTIGVGEDSPPTSIGFEATDAVVDLGAPLQAYIPVMGEARADVYGSLRRAHGATEDEERYVAHIKRGTLRGEESETGWVNCDGWIRVSPRQYRVLDFTAQQGDATLRVTGTLPRGTDPDVPLALDITAERADMVPLSTHFVPRGWTEMAAALGLSGRGSAHVRLRAGEGEAGGAVADIGVTAEHVRPTPVPLELHSARVRAQVSAGNVQVLDAQAGLGERGKVSGAGTYSWGTDSSGGRFDLSAEKLELNAELVAALPERAARLLRRLTPSGELDLRLSEMRISGAGRRTWDIAGVLAIRNGALELGLPLADFDGGLEGTCQILEDGDVNLDAALNIARGKLAERRISNWTGHLSYAAGGRWVLLEDLRGELCAGDALGHVRVDTESSAYEVSLTLQRVLFGELFPGKPSEEDAPPRAGLVDGRIELRGIAGDDETRVGSGTLRIYDMTNLESDVLTRVVEASREAERNVANEFDRAEFRFVLRGAELTLTRLDIEGKDLRLVGTGTWNQETDALDLTMLGASPKNWPRIAGLSEIIEAAGQELLQYRITGTLSSPSVSVEPLHKLNETLRALFEGE